MRNVRWARITPGGSSICTVLMSRLFSCSGAWGIIFPTDPAGYTRAGTPPVLNSLRSMIFAPRRNCRLGFPFRFISNFGGFNLLVSGFGLHPQNKTSSRFRELVLGIVRFIQPCARRALEIDALNQKKLNSLKSRLKSFMYSMVYFAPVFVKRKQIAGTRIKNGLFVKSPSMLMARFDQWPFCKKRLTAFRYACAVASMTSVLAPLPAVIIPFLKQTFTATSPRASFPWDTARSE